MTKTLYGSLLLLASTSVYAETESFQHQIGLGFSDLRDANDNFIGLQYAYYLDSVSLGEQPWLISPYLQRSSNVDVSYFTVDNISLLAVNGEFFANNDWVYRGRFRHQGEDDGDFEDDEYQVGIDIGKFITSNWEVGGGVDYFDFRAKIGSIGGNSPLRFEENEIGFNVYARYTSFDAKALNFVPGWDTEFKAMVIDEVNSISANTRYFFSPQWSASLGLTYREDRNSDNTIAEIATDYWFSPSASIQFGLGFDVDDGSLGSATLLGTFRF